MTSKKELREHLEEQGEEFAGVINSTVYDETDPTYLEKRRSYKEAKADLYEEAQRSLPEAELEELVDLDERELGRHPNDTYQFELRGLDQPVTIDLEEPREAKP